MDPWKRRFLLETTISRFHVNFWGCSGLKTHRFFQLNEARIGVKIAFGIDGLRKKSEPSGYKVGPY